MIRLKTNRRVKEQGEIKLLLDVLKKARLFEQREIEISKRKKSNLPHTLKVYPQRSSRKVSVNIRAQSIDLTQTYLSPGGYRCSTDKTINLNVVHVYEPNNNKDPIDWMLVTNESIADDAAVGRVIDLYRRRWLIEEFFKGLKTGCNIEKHQLEEAESWFRMLPFYLIVCARILNLRNMDLTRLNLRKLKPWLTETQLKILINFASSNGRKVRTYQDAKLELARMGGHLARNGPPGWLTLLRGYTDLLNLEIGWSLAMNTKM